MVNKQVIQWLLSAYADLKSVKYLLNDEFLTHVAAFHSQQAVEKILKSILENNGKDVPKVHKLQNLIARVDLNIEIDDEIIMILDELYIESRYPGDMGLLPEGKPTKEDAKTYYEFSRSFFEEVCELLGVDIKKATHDQQ